MEGFLFTAICNALIATVLVLTIGAKTLSRFSLLTILSFSLMLSLVVSASLFF